MATWIAIAVGGAFGASLRWAIYRALTRPGHETVDGRGIVGGTLVVNLLGTFCLGWVVSVPASAAPWTMELLPFGAVGLCGALTTFSTLCADAFGQVRRGGAGAAALYVAAHVVLGPIAIALGAAMAA